MLLMDGDGTWPVAGTELDHASGIFRECLQVECSAMDLTVVEQVNIDWFR
jgi:hypothetical protein